MQQRFEPSKARMFSQPLKVFLNLRAFVIHFVSATHHEKSTVKVNRVQLYYHGKLNTDWTNYGQLSMCFNEHTYLLTILTYLCSSALSTVFSEHLMTSMQCCSPAVTRPRVRPRPAVPTAEAKTNTKTSK